MNLKTQLMHGARSRTWKFFISLRYPVQFIYLDTSSSAPRVKNVSKTACECLAKALEARNMRRRKKDVCIEITWVQRCRFKVKSVYVETDIYLSIEIYGIVTGILLELSLLKVNDLVRFIFISQVTLKTDVRLRLTSFSTYLILSKH